MVSIKGICLEINRIPNVKELQDSQNVVYFNTLSLVFCMVRTGSTRFCTKYV